MECRLSSRGRPSPEDALAWGSQSASRILRPSSARQAARLIAVVVLPTPPFWFTTPRILPMAFQGKGRDGVRAGGCVVENLAELWKAAKSRIAGSGQIAERDGFAGSSNFGGYKVKKGFTGGKLPRILSISG